MSIRMRMTRSKTGHRRSHHGIRAPRLSVCNDCGAHHLRHRVCDNCGRYRGTVVVDVAAAAEKKAAKQQAKQREMEQMTGQPQQQQQDQADASNTSEETNR
jgi:large subunit ribosomal protein L32